jgi:hypothetical protein
MDNTCIREQLEVVAKLRVAGRDPRIGERGGRRNEHGNEQGGASA